MTARVSVILPTYNRAATLGRAIHSVLGQTFTDFELLVVDDASIDGTAELVAGISDPRLRYLRRAVRGGAGAARNTGIAAAQGSLIAFQDSDDEWLAYKLEQQVQLLEASPPEVGMVYCRALRWDGRTTTCIPSPWAGYAISGEIHQATLRRNFVSTQTWLVRRECFDAIGLLDENLQALEDWEWMIRCSQRYQVGLVDALLVMVHESGDSLSRNLGAYIQATEEIIRKHRNTLFPEHSFNLANLHFLLGARHHIHGNALLGRQTLAKALGIYPWALRFYLGWLLTLCGDRAFRRVWEFARTSVLRDFSLRHPLRIKAE